MRSQNNFDKFHVDFQSPKIERAKSIVQRDLHIIANKFDLSLESLKTAFQNGDVLVGIYNTPCGKSCICIEYNDDRLITPFREIH
ncbi:MAG: hypothetical protein AAGB35_09355 [Pseudomonadota bacterium]